MGENGCFETCSLGDQMTKQGVGLMADLDEWHAWAGRQRRVRRGVRALKGRARPIEPDTGTLYRPEGEIRTLVVVDQISPSCDKAILEPLAYLDPRTTAVLAPTGASLADTVGERVAEPFVGTSLLGADVSAVLSLGAYLGLSGPVEAWAQIHDIPFYLVQHGLLTPWSPPASKGAHVLAWCDADAEYWSANRPDLHVEVAGSQLLWAAAEMPDVTVRDERPVMLGQLHGTELSRADALRTYLRYCGDGAMDYRAHPNEADTVSRALHGVMRRRGVRFETSREPLPTLARPVVSIFSTGTLEAAMRGLPAYVAHPDPAPWIRDFWRRYDLGEWGGEPTRAWAIPAREPAVSIARIVEDA